MQHHLRCPNIISSMCSQEVKGEEHRENPRLQLHHLNQDSIIQSGVWCISPPLQQRNSPNPNSGQNAYHNWNPHTTEGHLDNQVFKVSALLTVSSTISGSTWTRVCVLLCNLHSACLNTIITAIPSLLSPHGQQHALDSQYYLWCYMHLGIRAVELTFSWENKTNIYYPRQGSDRPKK